LLLNKNCIKNKNLETSFKPSSNASSSPNTPNLSTYLQIREKEFLKSDQMSFTPEQTKDALKPKNFADKKEFFFNKDTSNEILNSTPGAPPLNFNSAHYMSKINGAGSMVTNQN